MRARGCFLAIGLQAGCAAPGSKATSPAGDTGGETEPIAPCDADAPVGLEVGMCAPEFELPDRDGTLTRLSDFRGKVALVDISALW
jgi:cytochrome oxidase Cu insertion factor (SCO1/SenC/PrrC family)